MKSSLRAVLVGAFIAFAPPAAAAAELPDPKICLTSDGFVEVAKAWLLALDSAHSTGRITQQDYTSLAVWWQQMQNWMVETNKVKETCEALLQTRRDYGF